MERPRACPIHLVITSPASVTSRSFVTDSVVHIGPLTGHEKGRRPSCLNLLDRQNDSPAKVLEKGGDPSRFRGRRARSFAIHP